MKASIEIAKVEDCSLDVYYEHIYNVIRQKNNIYKNK